MENRMIFKESKKRLEVIFEGEIDHQSTLNYREVLIRKIDEKYFEEVIFNFEKVSFIDSSGIGMILGRYNQLNKSGAKLFFTKLSDTTYRLFDLSGLLKIISIKEVDSHE